MAFVQVNLIKGHAVKNPVRKSSAGFPDQTRTCRQEETVTGQRPLAQPFEMPPKRTASDTAA